MSPTDARDATDARATPPGLPRLTVLSQRAAERYRPAQPAACISVTGSGAGAAPLPLAYRAVLRLVFDDVPTSRGDAPPGARAFRPCDAREVAAFVRRVLEAHAPAELVVHCHFGASRSAGLALGIAEGLGYPADEVAALERALPAHHREVRRMTARALRGPDRRSSRP